MVHSKALLFLGLSLFTLIGFILKSLSRYDQDSYSSSNPGIRMISEVTFVILTAVMWLVLIFR